MSKKKKILPGVLAAILMMAGLVFGAAGTAAAAPDYQRLVNGDGDTAGKCLDFDQASFYYVQLWSCRTGVSQQLWHYHPIGLGGMEIWSAQGGCVNAAGQGSGARVIVSNCTTSYSTWTATRYGDWIQWRNAATNKCLDVKDYGLSNVVQMWDCLDQGNQKWKMTI